jgi:membrane protein required for beta-lactamase induction
MCRHWLSHCKVVPYFTCAMHCIVSVLHIVCIIMSKLLVVLYIEKYFKFVSHPTLSLLLLISICFCSPQLTTDGFRNYDLVQVICHMYS